jgi:hypothetical protein
MGAPKGNKYAEGKATGRKSAFEERQDAQDAARIWFDEAEKVKLQEKYKSGKMSGREIFHLMVLEKNEKMVKTLADKMLPDKIDSVGLSNGFSVIGQALEKTDLLRQEFEKKLKEEIVKEEE